jgi:hypothetical protein
MIATRMVLLHVIYPLSNDLAFCWRIIYVLRNMIIRINSDYFLEHR